jgi:hypothetical protein
MQRSFWTRLKSRKFLSALFSAIFIILNEGLGAPINREAYAWITGVITAFILGESYVDGKAAENTGNSVVE